MPPLQEAELDSILLDTFHLMSHLHFLGKVVEKVVAQQLQQALDEADYFNYSVFF